MNKIKEKPVLDTPKILSKVTQAPKELMKRSLQSVKDHGENVYGHSESPDGYASEKFERGVDTAVEKTKDTVKSAGNKVKNKVKSKLRDELLNKNIPSNAKPKVRVKPTQTVKKTTTLK